MKCLRYMFGLGLLLAVMVGCNPHPTSSQLSSVGKGKSYQTLVGIDSLMWEQPDSALKVMMQFAASSEADSLNAFEGHYCQMLIAELLYKNRYAQSNRTEVLKAVGYFDSIDNAFLDARAHYIKGVGYYERDSLIEACKEYLNALRMMEGHFEEKVLVGHKARFMALTYNRLVELFSAQYMQEPAIYCGKQSLAYNRMAKSSPRSLASTLRTIGRQYDKLDLYDSASFYYNAALKYLPDRNDILYRDVFFLMAFSEYDAHHNVTISLDSLKSMAAQATDEAERLTRYSTIGYIYYDTRQFDSAKVYLIPVFDKDPDRASMVAGPLREIALIEGDTVKANQYAQFLIEDVTSAAKNQAQVSKLNDLFQNYLQEKQETALALERLEARRRNLWIGGGVALLAIVGLTVAIVTRRSHKKRLAAQEAEAQRRLDEASQRLNEAAQRHDEEQRELQTKVEQAAQLTREMLLQRVADIYQSNTKDRLQRILEAVDDTYPQAVAKLKEEHPELGEAERNILLLNFFHFRIKEEADLLGLSENTVAKYRSNLGKTLGKDPISDWI